MELARQQKRPNRQSPGGRLIGVVNQMWDDTRWYLIDINRR